MKIVQQMESNTSHIIDGVSIIIPTYNRMSYLYSTLICLLNQKINRAISYEVIIIDSGNDNTCEMVKQIQEKQSISILYEKIQNSNNRSLLRNKGAEHAHYEILLFLDNDMLAPPDFVQRHYECHLHRELIVELGCRKCLTSFDITKITESILQSNFQILDTLPFYLDDRLTKDISVEPWRFAFSHTLSMRKTTFINSGRFNVEFGNHWGCEDLELGFRLMSIGCAFELMPDIFTFHQPHFHQSNMEQHESSHNSDLFVKLHNCFEVELCESFYTSFDEYYPLLKEIKKKNILPDKKQIKEYDYIFGCLFSRDEQAGFATMQLGIWCIMPDSACNSVLVLNAFFDFPQLFQESIIFEAFRVSKKVCYEDLCEERIREVTKIALAAGIQTHYSIKDNIFTFFKSSNVTSDSFIFLLPDVFSPEKRYVYIWFAQYLVKNGKFVNLRDMKCVQSFCSEDFRLQDSESALMSKKINKYLGKSPYQLINSLTVLYEVQNTEVTNNKRNCVFHDEDYIMMNTSMKYRNLNASNHFDESVFGALAFLSIYGECWKVMENKKEKSVENTIFCFHENGFLEDGMDIILPAFAEYIKTRPSLKLLIKMPHYEELYNSVYEHHNESSKMSKLFPVQTKKKLDMYRLKEMIAALGIENSIEIIEKNLAVSDIIAYISKSDTLIFASRGCFVPPQVYASIILGRKTIISSHHTMLSPFNTFCTIVDSKLCSFPEELEVPPSCLNIVFLAGRTRADELVNKLDDEHPRINNTVLMDIYKKCTNLVENTFVEGKKREIQLIRTESHSDSHQKMLTNTFS